MTAAADAALRSPPTPAAAPSSRARLAGAAAPRCSCSPRDAFGWSRSLLLLTRRGRRTRTRRAAAVYPKMARPPILSVALPSDTGRVLSIQSHTVQGYVGNKSAVFPLQLLGFDVDPINSVQFSNHTGYPTFRGQVLDGKQLWDLIEGLEENQLLHYTHLLTGYIGSVSFLETVLQVVDKLRSVNPDLLYVCDPVLGDEGKLYVPQELISVYQQKVVPVASMLTPNQFEIELLTGLRITSEQDGLTACNTLHTAGPQKVVITSALIEGKLLLIGSHKKTEEQPPEQFKIEIPKIPAYFTGTKIIGASKPCLTPRRCTPPAQQAWSSCPDEVELECTHIRPSRCWMRSGHYAAGWKDSLISKVYNRSRRNGFFIEHLYCSIAQDL